MSPTGIRLHIDADALTLTSTGGVLRAPVGPVGLTERRFRHALPTPVELEAAIQEVEDALQPLPRQGGAALHADRAGLAPLLAFAHVPADRDRLSRDEVEACFTRFAALAEGRPVVQDPLPDAPYFAALLLLVRELMHHLDFAVLRIVP